MKSVEGLHPLPSLPHPIGAWHSFPVPSLKNTFRRPWSENKEFEEAIIDDLKDMTLRRDLGLNTEDEVLGTEQKA